MSKNIDIEKAVKYLQWYMNTYAEQVGYREYQDKTYIDDVLYGLGLSINRTEYQFAGGYNRFKEFLREFLKE